MSKIKCSVYLIRDDYYPPPDLNGVPPEYAKFFDNRPKFCDAGDDPSFYCSRKYKSNVTWCVCRHNVRQALDIDDEVHFVACDKSVKHSWKYYYVGYGVVDEKITHRDLFEKREYFIFKEYFNNIIRPVRDGYIHYEPLPLEYWHEDWKMRISSKRSYKQLEEVEEDLEHGICGIGRATKKKVENRIAKSFPFGKNYIIFSKNKSRFILSNPPLIAEVQWSGTELFTKWKSKKIQKLFGDTQLRESFTNKSKQHTVFDLFKENAEKLKKLI